MSGAGPAMRHGPALLALAWVMLPLAWFLPLWLMALGGAALLGRGWLARRAGRLPSRWLLLPLLMLSIGGAWLQLGTLIGREGGVALLVLLTAFKAYETATLRDWRVLLALGFFLAAMPLLFNQSLLMAAWLVAALLLLTWATAMLAGGLPRGSWRSAAQALLLSLPIMLVLFVMMPRLPEPLWSMPRQQPAAGSGLGEDMEPGSISKLILNREPAFSVVFDGPPPRQDQLYWRVMLLDAFDGRRWLRAAESRPSPLAISGGRPLAYSLTLRADQGRVPALEMPQAATPGSHMAPGGLLRQDRGQDDLARYRLLSMVGARLSEPLSAGRRAFYLQLPAGNARSRALAWQLRQRGGGETGFVREALQYLRLGGFRYTLQPPLLGEQPVDAFLFGTRQGFCEHYASAFAFLARAAGMPARVVIGYQGGEYNPLGRFWLVRSSDAHAWVEVWLADQRQWLRVDPTSAVSPNRLEQGAEQSLPALRGADGAGAARTARARRCRRNGCGAAAAMAAALAAAMAGGEFRLAAMGGRLRCRPAARLVPASGAGGRCRWRQRGARPADRHGAGAIAAGLVVAQTAAAAAAGRRMDEVAAAAGAARRRSLARAWAD